MEELQIPFYILEVPTKHLSCRKFYFSLANVPSPPGGSGPPATPADQFHAGTLPAPVEAPYEQEQRDGE